MFKVTLYRNTIGLVLLYSTGIILYIQEMFLPDSTVRSAGGFNTFEPAIKSTLSSIVSFIHTSYASDVLLAVWKTGIV